MKSGLIGIILLHMAGLFAQADAYRLPVQITWAGQKVVLDSAYQDSHTQAPITLDAVKLYVGHVRFLKGDEVIQEAFVEHQLLDVEQPQSLFIPFLVDWPTGADKLRFTLGVDSLTSVSGAFGGDLDPMKGMYWTWQSGYIHAKIEGTSPVCPSRKNRFQFHLGGYAAPFATAREIEIPIPSSNEGKLVLALDQFLDAIELSRTYQVMSPGESAMELADELSNAFSLQP